MEVEREKTETEIAERVEAEGDREEAERDRRLRESKDGE